MRQIVFNGGAVCGFGEYLGILKYIQQNNISFDKIYGISAGTGIAICILFNIPWKELFDFYNEIIKDTKIGDSLTINHIKGLEFVFKNKPPDAYKDMCGKLYIRLSGENGAYWKSQFSSNHDLMNAMVCGGSIPFLSTYECIDQGLYAYDGGIISSPKMQYMYTPITPFPLSVIPPTDILLTTFRIIGEIRFANLLKKTSESNDSVSNSNIEKDVDNSTLNIFLHRTMKIYNALYPPIITKNNLPY